MNLRELLVVVWKRRFVVTLVFLLSGALGAVFAIVRTQMYESTVTIAMTPDVDAGQGLVPADYLSAILGTYAETAESEQVRRLANSGRTTPLPGMVESTAERNTGILRIAGRADSPVDARTTADATAQAFLSTIRGNRLLVAQVVDPAEIPTDAVQPRPPLIIGTSLLIGLGAGIMLALLVDPLRRRIETPSDLAEVTQLPLLGQIPRSRELARSVPKVVWGDPSQAEVEESFRSLRTSLTFVAPDAKVIQVTSATDRQGKSTVVANLAVAFASTGVRTVIVDADLRRPAQAGIFMLDGSDWRVSLQAAAASWTLRTRQTAFDNLSILPSGPARDDPTGLLQVRFARVLEALRGRYDIVLVDSPPTLPVSDARIASRWSDAVILIVAADEEKPSAFQQAVNELELAGAKLKGVVLNAASSPPWGYSYYYGAGSEAAGRAGAEEFARAEANRRASDRPRGRERDPEIRGTARPS